jgi:hypothetical protein
MRRTLIAGVLLAAAAAAAAAASVAWYAGRAHDARAAGQRLQADTTKLISDLRLRAASPDPPYHQGADGAECGVVDGAGRQLSKGPHRQYAFGYTAGPPSGRAVTELGKDAESALHGLGYRIVTSEIRFDVPPPPGTVVARGRDLEITLYPQPDEGLVRITGTSDCLPVS